MSPVTVSLAPSRLTDDAGDRGAGVVGLSRTASALINSSTLACSSAGRTPSTSASDLAWTMHGKPSQLSQRMHALYGMLLLVEHHAARRVERVVTERREVVGELLDPRLVATPPGTDTARWRAARSGPRRGRRARW